jgi:hypothetical protein
VGNVCRMFGGNCREGGRVGPLAAVWWQKQAAGVGGRQKRQKGVLGSRREPKVVWSSHRWQTDCYRLQTEAQRGRRGIKVEEEVPGSPGVPRGKTGMAVTLVLWVKLL